MNTLCRQIHSISDAKDGSMQFSIASFNVLAHNLATHNHFPYVRPSSILDWTNRRCVLLDEIKNLLPDDDLPDILCLVECSDYTQFWLPELAALGYNSVYECRPSVHYSSWSGCDKKDGCGLFVQKNVFSIINHIRYDYNDLHDRIALVVDLKHASGIEFSIALTHLFWDQNLWEDQIVELKQLEKLMNSLARPILVVGDFNSPPSGQIYNYLSEHFLQPSYYMKSVYDLHPIPESGQLFTSIKPKRCSMIDYIWYSQSFIPNRLLLLPTKEQIIAENFEAIGTLDQEAFIPNHLHGSDHLPILAFLSI